MSDRHTGGDIRRRIPTARRVGRPLEPQELWQREPVDSARLAGSAVRDNHVAQDGLSGSVLRAGTVLADRMMVGVGDNLLVNGSFESFYGVAGQTITTDTELVQAIPGWSTIDLGGGEVTVQSTTPYQGLYRLRFVQNGTTPDTIRIRSTLIPVEPGTSMRCRAWVRGAGTNVGAANAQVNIGWIQSDGTSGSATSPSLIFSYNAGTTTSYAMREGVAVVPSDAHYARVYLASAATSAASTVISFDEVQFYRLPEDFRNSTGSVVIDSDGIVISDGALEFKDEFGSEVLTGGGFGSSWLNFIQSRLYNSNFEASVVGTLADGRTAALPYWTVSRSGSGSTITVESTSDMPAQKSVKMVASAGADSLTIRSDRVPVSPGHPHTVVVVTRANNATFDYTINVSLYNAAGTFVRTVSQEPSNAILNTVEYLTGPSILTADTEVYCEVELVLQQETGHTASATVRVGQVMLLAQPRYNGLSSIITYTVGGLVADGGPVQLNSGSQITMYDGDTFYPFTPTIGGGGTATFFVSATTGWYQTIGKMAFLNIVIAVDAAGSGASTVTVEVPGLTFWRTNRQTLIATMTGISSTAAGTGSAWVLTGGSAGIIDVIRAPQSNAANVDENIVGSDLTAGALIVIQGWVRLV